MAAGGNRRQRLIDATLRRLRRFEALERNEDLVASLLQLGTSRSSEERDEAIVAFNTAAARRQLRRLAPQGLEAAKGKACQLLSDDVTRELRETAHLGTLAELASVPATRLDYTALILDQLLQLKESRAFPGLGSRSSMWPHGTLLELMQCWAILHNWGHLFGTFATERGLLYELERDAKIEQSLFAPANLHEALREHVREVLDSRNLHHFYYALSALRASTQLTGERRKIYCEALAAFFQHRKENSLQYAAFRRVRQLAYHRLHSVMQLERSCDLTTNEAAVTELFEDRDLCGQEAEPPLLVDLLRAHDTYQGRRIFASPQAAANVLAHNRAFKYWWRKHADEKALERVTQLFSRPKDWPEEGPQDLRHWFTCCYHADEGRWMHEVQAWAKQCPWQDGNFLVSPMIGKPSILSDVYLRTPTGEPTPEVCHGVSKALADKCLAAVRHSHDDSALGISIGRLAVRCLEAIVADGVTVQLTRADGIAPFAWAVSLSADHCVEELRTLARGAQSEQRRAELDGMIADIQATQIAGGATVLAILGETRLFDLDQGNCLKEIDGVWCAITEDEVVWRFLEQKASKRTGREAQLAELRPFLRVPMGAPERLSDTVEVAGATCVWRG